MNTFRFETDSDCDMNRILSWQLSSLLKLFCFKGSIDNLHSFRKNNGVLMVKVMKSVASIA